MNLDSSAPDLSGMDDDLELLARLDRHTREAELAVQRAQRFAAGLEHLQGRGVHGGVRVRVDRHGLLQEITFEPSTRGTAPDVLARACLAAVAAAHAEVLEQLARHARDVWGEDAPVAAQVVAEAAQRFGAAR